MDNKLTLRQIAPGLYSNPEGPAQIQPVAQSMDPSMKEQILAALAQSGALNKLDAGLAQVPQPPQDMHSLIMAIHNRIKPDPSVMPVEPAAQATQQQAQKIGGQINPDDDVEQTLAQIRKTRSMFGGVK